MPHRRSIYFVLSASLLLLDATLVPAQDPQTPDIVASGFIDMDDLFQFSYDWRSETDFSAADLDRSTRVDANDLLSLLRSWHTQTLPAPVLLSVAPDHGPPGTLVRLTVANRESLVGRGHIHFGTAALPILSSSGDFAMTLAPAMMPGPATVALEIAGQSSNPLSFDIKEATTGELAVGEVAIGIVTTTQVFAEAIENFFVTLKDQGKATNKQVSEVAEVHGRIDSFAQASIAYIQSLSEEDQILVDSILRESGLSDAYGVTGSGTGTLKDLADTMKVLSTQKGSEVEFALRVGMDNLSFTLSTVVRPGMLVGAIVVSIVATPAAGGAIYKVATIIEYVDKFIDSFIATDLSTLHVDITPDSPPNLNVGETASLIFTGDFDTQDNQFTTLLGLIVSLALPAVEYEALQDLLVKIVVDTANSAGWSLLEPAWDTGLAEADVQGVAVDIEYYENNLGTIFLGVSTGGLGIAVGALHTLFNDLGYTNLPFFGATPLASGSPSLFTYLPQSEKVQANGVGTITASKFDSNVWRLDKLENWRNPFKYLGIEWPEQADVRLSPDHSTIHPGIATSIDMVNLPPGSFLMGDNSVTQPLFCKFGFISVCGLIRSPSC